MASAEPSSLSTPGSLSLPAPIPAPVASPPAAAIAVPGTRAGTALTLASANTGFDHIFGNQIALARTAFRADNTPFHLFGLGRLTGSDGKGDGGGRFAAGLEYEILQADAVVLLGLTHALSESYMGYFQCMYSLNAAHSKFTKLYKTVFPAGLHGYSSTSAVNSTFASPSNSSSAGSSRNPPSLTVTTLSDEPPVTAPAPAAPTPTSATRSIFGRWSASTASPPSSRSAASSPKTKPSASPTPQTAEQEKAERERPAEGPVEEIVSGTAFDALWFACVFVCFLCADLTRGPVILMAAYYLPLILAAYPVPNPRGTYAWIRGDALSMGLPSLLGHARRSSLYRAQATLFNAYSDRLVLMSFYGVFVVLSGYQADEARTVRTYKAVVAIEARYPTGALWILNRAKVLRMSNDAEAAIAVLQRGLQAEQTFVQAETLLVFELAWTLLSQRRHQETADAFVRLTKLNSWYVIPSFTLKPSYYCAEVAVYFAENCPRSHATYYFIAAGCYTTLGNRDKAQELLDAVPELLQRRKAGGKNVPTEVLIRKKLEFYKEKQKRRGGDPARFVEAITISPADELGIFWNIYQRINDDVARAHITELAAMTSPVAVPIPSPLPFVADDNAQSLCAAQEQPGTRHARRNRLRALLLGIMYRTLRMYAPARALLESARSAQGMKISTWIAGVALCELAVTDLKDADDATEGTVKGKVVEPLDSPFPLVLLGPAPLHRMMISIVKKEHQQVLFSGCLMDANLFEQERTQVHLILGFPVHPFRGPPLGLKKLD
ncbi:Mitochondrial outer membrane protein IML2 [Mycena sanguinolenta]|uniref:Mitochondrial outer membrane protein IML2 n=1 Tax=Mycena sanguinolenta TaxID=230812 RepID=A0A8H6YHS1_9AGAR|nr:Mitochondrial outer membrane protein IML2 [Mycena sanguinolenta]